MDHKKYVILIVMINFDRYITECFKLLLLRIKYRNDIPRKEIRATLITHEIFT